MQCSSRKATSLVHVHGVPLLFTSSPNKESVMLQANTLTHADIKAWFEDAKQKGVSVRVVYQHHDGRQLIKVGTSDSVEDDHMYIYLDSLRDKVAQPRFAKYKLEFHRVVSLEIVNKV
jgi:hypothetical protein